MSLLIISIMKALKCKPSVQFAYNYSINVLSKCSNIISHRSSVFESRHIDLRRLTHRSSIFKGRHIDHRSSNVDTSISKGRHIDLRTSTHRSPKVDTSIFESRHIDLRRPTHRSLKIEGGNIAPTIHHRILSTTALHSIIP